MNLKDKIFIILLVFCLGCGPTPLVSEVYVGMTKREVILIVGHPMAITVTNNVENWFYAAGWCYRDLKFRFVDGKLISKHISYVHAFGVGCPTFPRRDEIK